MPGIAQLARSEEEKYNSARSPEISGRFSLSLSACASFAWKSAEIKQKPTENHLHLPK